MPAAEQFLGVDIGGTSVKTGVVTAEGRVLSRRTAPAPVHLGREAAVASIFEEAEQALQDAGLTYHSLSGIGVAAPGTLDLDAGVILQPFNLPGWENLPLRSLTVERFGLPAVLLNDANAAAYGEYWIGSGRGCRSLMLWTLGTGVGGGIVVNGEILLGAHGHAGEAGHQIIQCEGGPQSEHGIHGSVELYCGAKALVRRCRAALLSGARSTLSDVEARGALTPRDIAAAAEAGDEFARRLVRETAYYLGVGTINVLHLLNPDRVLIGGAMTFGGKASPVGRMFLEEVRSTVREMGLPVPAEETVIDFAELGSDAGFIGAAGWARRQLLMAPPG